MSAIDQAKQFIPLSIAVLTISDTRSLADDKSGTTLADRLTAAGHKLAAREIVTDDVEAIRGVIRKWIADEGVDVIITTGGTGFTGRDQPIRQRRAGLVIGERTGVGNRQHRDVERHELFGFVDGGHDRSIFRIPDAVRRPSAPQRRDPLLKRRRKHGPRISSAPQARCAASGARDRHPPPEPNVLQACTVPR